MQEGRSPDRRGRGDAAGGRESQFDPFVAIMDTSRFELATSDDTALLRQDSIASVIIPATAVTSSRSATAPTAAGSGRTTECTSAPSPARWRSTRRAGRRATRSSSPTSATPRADHPDVQGSRQVRRADRPLRRAGRADRPVRQLVPRVELPERDGDRAERRPRPRQWRRGSTPAEVPVAFNGIIEKPNDYDYFKFKAAKGQVLEIGVYGRRVRSPLDPVLVLFNDKRGRSPPTTTAAGRTATCGSTSPPTAFTRSPSATTCSAAGPDFVYRVEITQIEPRLTLTIPLANQIGQPTQERQTIVVPGGNRFGTLFRGTRADFGGDLC